MAVNGHKFVRLFGDIERRSGESASEGDLSLCRLLAFWTDKDPDLIDAIFRLSNRMRPKWDTRHFSSGQTYGERTIEVAIQRQDEIYRW